MHLCPQSMSPGCTYELSLCFLSLSFIPAFSFLSLLWLRLRLSLRYFFFFLRLHIFVPQCQAGKTTFSVEPFRPGFPIRRFVILVVSQILRPPSQKDSHCVDPDSGEVFLQKASRPIAITQSINSRRKNVNKKKKTSEKWIQSLKKLRNLIQKMILKDENKLKCK